MSLTRDVLAVGRTRPPAGPAEWRRCRGQPAPAGSTPSKLDAWSIASLRNIRRGLRECRRHPRTNGRGTRSCSIVRHSNRSSVDGAPGRRGHAFPFRRPRVTRNWYSMRRVWRAGAVEEARALDRGGDVDLRRGFPAARPPCPGRAGTTISGSLPDQSDDELDVPTLDAVDLASSLSGARRATRTPWARRRRDRRPAHSRRQGKRRSQMNDGGEDDAQGSGHRPVPGAQSRPAIRMMPTPATLAPRRPSRASANDSPYVSGTTGASRARTSCAWP